MDSQEVETYKVFIKIKNNFSFKALVDIQEATKYSQRSSMISGKRQQTFPFEQENKSVHNVHSPDSTVQTETGLNGIYLLCLISVIRQNTFHLLGIYVCVW